MKEESLNYAIRILEEKKALEELYYYISDKSEKLISGFKVCLNRTRDGGDRNIYNFRAGLCNECKEIVAKNKIMNHLEESEKHLLNLPVSVNKLIKYILLKKLKKMINNCSKEFEKL